MRTLLHEPFRVELHDSGAMKVEQVGPGEAAGRTIYVRGRVLDWLTARRRLVDIGNELILADMNGGLVNGVLPGDDAAIMKASSVGPQVPTVWSASIGLHCAHYSGSLNVALRFENGSLVERRRAVRRLDSAWIQVPLDNAHRFLLGGLSLAEAGGTVRDWITTGTVLVVVSSYLPDPLFDPTARAALAVLDQFYSFDRWLGSVPGWNWRTTIQA